MATKRNTWSNYTGGKSPPTINLTSGKIKSPLKRTDNSKAIRIGRIQNTLAYIFGLEWLRQGQEWVHEEIRYK